MPPTDSLFGVFPKLRERQEGIQLRDGLGGRVLATEGRGRKQPWDSAVARDAHAPSEEGGVPI